MSDPSESPETSKKGQLNEKQSKLLVTMAQNTIGKVEYNWEKIAADLGYKNVATAKSTYYRLCSQLGGGGSGSKTSGEKSGGPVTSGPKTPTKVTKRSGKVGSSSAKKPRVKKATAAASAAVNAGDDDEENGKHIEVKNEPEDQDEDEVDAMMSGAL